MTVKLSLTDYEATQLRDFVLAEGECWMPDDLANQIGKLITAQLPEPVETFKKGDLLEYRSNPGIRITLGLSVSGEEGHFDHDLHKFYASSHHNFTSKHFVKVDE